MVLLPGTIIIVRGEGVGPDTGSSPYAWPLRPQGSSRQISGEMDFPERENKEVYFYGDGS